MRRTLPGTAPLRSRTWKNRAPTCRRQPAVDGQPDGQARDILGPVHDVPGRVEGGEADGLRGIEDLGLELLAAQPGPLVHGGDLGDELGCQVPGVGEGGLLRQSGGGLAEDPPQQLDGPGGGGDDRPGLLAEAEAEQDGLPHPLRVLPGAELVAPEPVELQPAGPLGLVGRQADRDGAVGPGQPALGGLEPRPVPGRCDGQDAAGPLDHRIAVIGGRRCDQPDPPGLARLGPVSDQLGGGAGLAGGPAAQQEPGAPIPLGRPLGGAGAMVHRALAGCQPAGAAVGVPVPGGPVGDRRRRRDEGLLEPGDAAGRATEAGHGRPSFPARRAAARGRGSWRRS